MRIEPVPYVYRAEDRRQRSRERREGNTERRSTARNDRRARHVAHPWLAPAFGAHLLGQAFRSEPVMVNVPRAFAQPEARTPLRPRLVKTA